MCGRFTQQRPTAELAELFEAQPRTEDAGGHYNVAPTADVTVILRPRPEEGRVLDAYRWGLVPSWADDPRIGNRLINARAETIDTSAAFRRSFAARRCLVPADGFYEWFHQPDRRGQPYLIRRRDGQPMALAGLWASWKDERHDAWLRSCTIITTNANALVARLHDRMPAILPREAWDRWLDPGEPDLAGLKRLLRPSPAEELEALPVSMAVNNPRNLGPELVKPIEGEVLRV